MSKERLKNHLKEKISMRWHMSLICILTMAVGLLLSKGILMIEILGPAFRYGISVLGSYLAFYLFVYWWLKIHFIKTRSETSMTDVVSGDYLPDGALDLSHHLGEGGSFSGGGASGSWGDSSSASSSSFGVDDLFFDEGVLIFLLIGLLVAVFGSAGYLIYQAPEILFEAAFEAILVSGLIKKSRQLKSSGWKMALFKKTWWLFGSILIVSIIFGFYLSHQCPGVLSFADFLKYC